MTRSIRSLVVAAALAAGILGGAVAPTQAQMIDACMIPMIPAYPGAQIASGQMLGMRGGMAHSVSVWATSDGLAQVFGYYRAQLAQDGFVDTTPSVALTMAGRGQGNPSGGELINSLELSKDGRQFVYITGTSPGYMLAVGCSQ